MRLITLLAAGCLTAISSQAGTLILPGQFSDHAVFQRDKPLPIWGKCAPGAEVAVRLAGQTASTQADAGGRWQVTLRPLEAGGPYDMQITAAGETRKVTDVLIGEVWLCSGQSNMGWPLVRSMNGMQAVILARSEKLRLLHIPVRSSDEDTSMITKTWQTVNSESAAQFSALAYYFGKFLQTDLAVPVGIILASHGGTPIIAWMPPQTVDNNPSLKEWADQIRQERTGGKLDAQKYDRQRSSGLFRGMVHPLAPLAMRGIAWYQGEHDVKRHALYRQVFPLFIESWRHFFDANDLPFLFVQLPNLGDETKEPVKSSDMASMRDAQAEALGLRGTGMVVALDLGDSRNVHPTNKEYLAKRLADLALQEVYGRTDVEARSPSWTGLEREGRDVIITFTQTAGGLAAPGSNGARNFELAGADQVFHAAKAIIEGKDKVRLQCADIPDPAYVRYAWADSPNLNVYGSSGLPLAPFTAAIPR